MESVGWCGGGLLDGHAGSAVKVLVAIHYSVLDARGGYMGNVVVWGVACREWQSHSFAEAA